jgi:hypothetical protein
MRRFTLLPVSALLLLACGTREDPTQRHFPLSTRGPTVTIVDSVVIAEPDSLPLGAYTSYTARSRRGDLFVADMSLRKVLHFDATGRLVGTLGRDGDGPGELRGPTSSGLLPGDSLLAVMDGVRLRIVIFGVDDAALRREVSAPRMQFVSQGWTRRGDTLIFGLTTGKTPIGKWWWRGDSIVMIGHTPERTLHAGISYGVTSVFATDSGYVVLFPAQPGLYLMNLEAEPTGFVRVPVARRRGEPTDLMERLKKLPKEQRFALVGSMALGLHRLPSGEWLLIHGDADVSRVGEETRGVDIRYYATVLSADLTQACIDGKLPLVTDVFSRPMFAADTLFLFTRNVGAAGIQSALLAMLVSTAGCDWQPTGGIEPPPRDSL